VDRQIDEPGTPSSPGRSLQGRRGLLLAGALLLLLIPRATVAGDVDPSTLRQVEAGFLYNFFFFVDWPDSLEGGELTLGVVGEDPFGPVLDTLREREIQGRRIELRWFDSLAAIEPCHILFVSASVADSLDQLLDRLEGHSVLTVSDMEDFVDRGGMIQFRVVDRRVRFDIDQAEAQEHGLRLSSQLLKVAREVRP